ncbi:MAG: hypothetical protein AAGF96_05965 [Bacteroidota bacterium]
MPSKLQPHIEEILSDLQDGKTFRAISKVYGVTLSTLHEFLNKPEHSARTQNALAISASAYADKGEEVLLNAKADRIEIQRARELAQHYRWMAGKRNPKKYGEASLIKIADSQGQNIQQNILFPASPIIMPNVSGDDSSQEDKSTDQTD